MIGEAKPYRRCLVMAGGGGRLGVHLGLHAAACEAGCAPDVLVGTCGGALVAALVHAEPDPARQLAWLAGPQMLAFWHAVRARRGASPAAALRGVVGRAFDRRLAPHVPDLEGDALYEVAGDWPALAWRAGGAPDVVVLGARLLYAAQEAGTRRGDRALFETVALGSARAVEALRGAPAATGTGASPGSAIAPRIAVVDDAAVALGDAVRISLTDMVYLPPAEALGARWLGGAVDLMPVELASRLAPAVWIDRKDPIPPWTMAPAWRAVLGIDGARRQRAVDAARVALRSDHRGLSRALPAPVLRRGLGRVDGRWALALAASTGAHDYRRLVHAQFEEGRRRAQAAWAAQGGRER